MSKNESNLARLFAGQPHEAMSLEDVMNAMEKGEGYIAEPGYMEEIIRLARVGLAAEKSLEPGNGK